MGTDHLQVEYHVKSFIQKLQRDGSLATTWGNPSAVPFFTNIGNNKEKFNKYSRILSNIHKIFKFKEYPEGNLRKNRDWQAVLFANIQYIAKTK